jgi:hypothetical protein
VRASAMTISTGSSSSSRNKGSPGRDFRRAYASAQASRTLQVLRRSSGSPVNGAGPSDVRYGRRLGPATCASVADAPPRPWDGTTMFYALSPQACIFISTSPALGEIANFVHEHPAKLLHPFPCSAMDHPVNPLLRVEAVVAIVPAQDVGIAVSGCTAVSRVEGNAVRLRYASVA